MQVPAADVLTFSQSVLEAVLAAPATATLLGHVKVVEISLQEGGTATAVFQVDVQPSMTNFMGGMHGGVVATLVDSLTTVPEFVMEILSRRSSKLEEVSFVQGTSVHLAVEYIGAAKVNDQLFCRCSVDKLGKRMHFLSAELYISKDGKQIPCYKATHTKMVLPGFEVPVGRMLMDQKPSLLRMLGMYFGQSKL